MSRQRVFASPVSAVLFSRGTNRHMGMAAATSRTRNINVASMTIVMGMAEKPGRSDPFLASSPWHTRRRQLAAMVRPTMLTAPPHKFAEKMAGGSSSTNTHLLER
jgi:hypothetical protein